MGGKWLHEMAFVFNDEHEKQFPVRRYQNRNLRDLDFPPTDMRPGETQMERSLSDSGNVGDAGIARFERARAKLKAYTSKPGAELPSAAVSVGCQKYDGMSESDLLEKRRSSARKPLQPSEDTSSVHVSSLLPYFTQATKYCTRAVLEDSVIDNESLKQAAFFKSFDPHFVHELFKVEGCTRAIVHLPEMEIAHQGDKADSLVVIVHGQVDIFVNGDWKRRLTDGDYFGEQEFLGASNERTCTAVCVTFCDARVMYRSCLTRTLDRCPAMKDAAPWHRKSEKDALRCMKVFTEKCMECIDRPDGWEIPVVPMESSFLCTGWLGGSSHKSRPPPVSTAHAAHRAKADSSSPHSARTDTSSPRSARLRKIGEASLKVARPS